MANPKMKQLNINPAVTFPSIQGVLWDAFLVVLSFPPLVVQSVSPRVPCCRRRLSAIRWQVTLCRSSGLNPESNLQPASSIIETGYLCWLVGSVTCATPGVCGEVASEREESQQPSQLKQPFRNTAGRKGSSAGFISNQNLYFKEQVCH